MLADQDRVVGLQRAKLVAQQLMCLLQQRAVALERHASTALGFRVQLCAVQPAFGIGQAILEHTFQARFGVALVDAATFGLFGAPLALALKVFEDDAHERDGGGDERAAAEAWPDAIEISGIHAACAPQTFSAQSVALYTEHA